MQLILGHSWPGNVRELEHCIERACVILQENKILPKHLHIDSEADSGLPSSMNLQNMKLDDVERTIILNSLERHEGNKTKAAGDLGISVRTLRNKLNRYEVSSKKKTRKKAK